MAPFKPITIIGGGLAGLSLGIGLRKQGIPATIIEAGGYPRHRVCGEFISGRGQQVLESLGLRELLVDAGAIPARTAAFFSKRTNSPLRPLRPSALCLSRFKMDDVLAAHFKRLGGELRDGVRWQKTGADPVVHATGRQARPVAEGWRWFGLKVHLRNVALEADLEMHLTTNGYVGLCRLSDGEVNACGLFRARPGDGHSGTSWKEILAGESGTPLHKRLAEAVFDEGSFCSVAGLSMAPRRAAELDQFCVGDALTMIPPVTGNGMSMAFESAAIAVGPLTRYSRGELTWSEAQQIVASTCDAAFARRLVWAGFLQRMMFAELLRGAIGAMALGSGLLWRLMFVCTR